MIDSLAGGGCSLTQHALRRARPVRHVISGAGPCARRRSSVLARVGSASSA